MKKTDEWQESGICNGGRTNGVCQEVWALLGPGCGCLSSGRFTMRRRWQTAASEAVGIGSLSIAHIKKASAPVPSGNSALASKLDNPALINESALYCV